MEDVWFGSGRTRRDVDVYSRALALQTKMQPLIAIAAKGVDDDVELVLASRAVFDHFAVDTSRALSHRLLEAGDPGALRLATLARTLPLSGAPRLERLRFSLGPGSELMTWLCRRIGVDGGGTVLIAAALDLKPSQPAPTASEPDIAAFDTASHAETVATIAEATATGQALTPQATSVQATSVQAMSVQATSVQATSVQATSVQATSVQAMSVQAIHAALRARWPSKRTVRFLWQTDADIVCTQVTPPLAEVVGIANADLVGRNLLELAPSLDPSGRLAAALAKRQTWSGLDVAWPMTDAPAAVSVGLGAVPAFDRDQTFDGYRGYGVIHLDRLIERDAMRLPPLTPLVGRAEPAPTNIVAFPGGQKTLSAEDQLAFDALGMELRDQAGIVPPEPVREAPSPPDAFVPTPSPPPPELDTRAGDIHIEPLAAPLLAAPLLADPLLEEPASTTTDPIPAAAEESAPTPAGDRAALIARNGLSVIDRLAVGLLVSRDNVPIFANRHLLDLTGFADETALRDAGGLNHLFGGLPGNVSGSEAVGVRDSDGGIVATNARMQRIDWDGEPAILLTLQPTAEIAPAAIEPAPDGLETARRSRLDEAKDHEDEHRQSEAARLRDEKQARDEHELREARAILETATDGIAVIDGDCNLLSLNRSAEALFGCDRGAVVGRPFLDLFASHNQDLAADYFEGLKSNATKSLLNDGRAILVKTRQGGTIPVFMTLGRLASPDVTPSGEPAGGARFCALFRDLTHWKKVEGELEAAKAAAERASALKTDFLAKVSHEIRTPLNAIIGFAEVIMEERFGPVGTERYKDYLRDIHASGTHVMSLVNDLLDLSKIEAGKMELAEEEIDANKVIGECVAIMQPQASRERVIMRMSLARGLPRIKADERSLRQIVLNLLSNAVKFNEPGGQVIVATTLTESGQAVIRIRDTGPGMSEQDIAAALEPFRQLSSRPMVGGTGLGLPLTKALVEANQAAFSIRSKVDQGTLVEVAFPPARVLAS